MRKFLPFLIIITFSACESSNEIVETPVESLAAETIAKTPSEFELKKLSPIQLGVGSVELEDDPFYKSNHYGSFYNDQLSCYVIDVAEGQIAGAKVSKVVLFYIDHILYKKKYILESNPIAEIKPEIKKYRVKSLTKDLKKACDELGNKACADLIIANDKFQFSWKKGILAFELYCWDSEEDKKFVLTEQQDDYKKALRFAKFQIDISE